MAELRILEISANLMLDESEFEWAYARSGGPGGQNVNKVESKAILRWNLLANTSIPIPIKERLKANHPSQVTVAGELLITSEKFRDKERNREECRAKLVAMLRRASVVPKPRKATKPTYGSKLRRLDEKKRQSDRKANRRGSSDD